MRVAEIINGVIAYRDATADEIADMERSEAEAERHQKQLPPTDSERIEAQVMYTAMMTDSLLED